jgi:plasmid stability protein
VDKTGVIVNLVCPGFCVTTLARNGTDELQEKMRTLHAQFGRTAEDGSRTLLHAVVAGVESHGKLLHSCVDGE